MLRQYGRFLDRYQDVPVRILNYLNRELGLMPTLSMPEADREATESSHQQRLREYFGYRTFDDEARILLEEHLRSRIAQGAWPEELFDSAMDALRFWKVVPPAVATVERIAASIAAVGREEMFGRIASRLDESARHSALYASISRKSRTPNAHFGSFPVKNYSKERFKQWLGVNFCRRAAGAPLRPNYLRGSTCRRIRYRRFSQPGGLWAKCVHTDPPIASVGWTEEEANRAGLSAIAYSETFTAVTEDERSVIDPVPVMLKILVDAESRQILGAHAIGDHAADLVNTAVLAMSSGTTIEDLSEITFVHPSAAETIRSSLT